MRDTSHGAVKEIAQCKEGDYERSDKEITFGIEIERRSDKAKCADKGNCIWSYAKAKDTASDRIDYAGDGGL